MTKRQEGGKEIAKSSALISVFNILGFMSALLVDIVTAARYGLGYETDAFFVAFTIPQLIGSVLLAAVGVALIPLFASLIVEKSKTSLWRTSSNLANLSLFAGGVLGGVGVLAAPLLIQILGAGLDEATRNLATALCALVFLMVVPLGAIEVFKSTLNSLQSFAVPAATVLVRNSIAFLVVICFSGQIGIRALAWGYVIGTWFQLVVLVGVLFLRGFRYHFVFDWRELRTAKALQQLRPPLVGAMLAQSNILFERFLASFLPRGLVSALVYARRIFRAVDSIFLGSISTALLPRLSTQFTLGKMSEYKRSLALGIKFNAFVAIPITAGIISLDVPIVRVLFERGVVSPETTRVTARLLSLYILGIPSMALFQMFVASYYAAGDTKTPFYVLVVRLGLNIALDLGLFLLLRAEGLALAPSLTRGIITAFLAWIVTRRLGALDSSLVSFLGKVGLASVVILLAVLGLRETAFNFARSGAWGGVLQIVIGTIIGAGLYVALLLLLRVKEMMQMMQLVRSRLKMGRTDVAG